MKEPLSIPFGFEYYDIEKSKKFFEFKKKLESIFNYYDILEFIPPLMDYKELFMISSTLGINSNTFLKEKPFETKDSNGDLLVIRPDITVMAMKSYIYQKEEISSIQYYYIQPVYRDYPIGSGFYREILQIGVEWIGNFSNRIRIMFSLLKEIMHIFSSYYTIVFSNSTFINTLLEYVPKNCRRELLKAFYFKDLERILAICKDFSISSDLKTILLEIPMLIGDREILKEYQKLLNRYPNLLKIVQETIDSIQDDVMFDFGLVKEFDYYTGPIFDGYLNQSSKKIISGGIYDNFSLQFSNFEIPSCGFAINFTELLNTETCG